MTRRRRLRRAGWAATLSGALLVGTVGGIAGDAVAGAASKSLTTVTMETPAPSGLTYLPYNVGMRYGIFAKYGIKLTLQLIKSTLAVSLIQEGKLDTMAATGSAESASVKGYSLPTYVAQGIRQDFGLVTQKTFSSVKQLKGKVIIGESGISAANQWERAVLKHYGLGTSTVSYVTAGNTSARAAYLEAGKGAATVLPTGMALQLKQKGFKVLTWGQFPTTDLVAGGFATSRTWADSHKKLMKNLVAAIVASTKYVIHNKAKSVKVLESKPFTLSPATAKATYNDIKPNWTPNGKPPKVAIQNQLHTLQLQYKMTSPPKATLIFTWKFIPKS